MSGSTSSSARASRSSRRLPEQLSAAGALDFRDAPRFDGTASEGAGMPSQHVVEDQETLLTIARKHGFKDEKAILAANPGLLDRVGGNTKVLPPGLVIQIPDKTEKDEHAPTEKTHV